MVGRAMSTNDEDEDEFRSRLRLLFGDAAPLADVAAHHGGRYILTSASISTWRLPESLTWASTARMSVVSPTITVSCLCPFFGRELQCT